jgi:hypothetical protein
MAGDWIKMRGALFEAPKVIGLARRLHGDRRFREWLTPGGGGSVNGLLVSSDALRCVTCALLMRVWSAAREWGKFRGDDLILPHITLADLDMMAGVGGFGDAMAAVGWARQDDGVVFPNFKEHNVARPPAERQKAYRDRLKEAPGGGPGARYGALRERDGALRPNSTVQRQKKNKTPTESSPLPPVLDTPEFRAAWADWLQHRRETRKPVRPKTAEKQLAQLAAWGPDRAVKAIEHSTRQGWQGIFEPKGGDGHGRVRPRNPGQEYDPARHGPPDAPPD